MPTDVEERPKRIQRRRTKGWRKPENTVIVDRTSRFGNWYRAEVFGQKLCIELFERSCRGFWSPSGIHLSLLSTAYGAHLKTLSKLGTFPEETIRAELRGKNVM